MEKRRIILICSTIPVLVLWALFYEQHSWAVTFWAYFGIDLSYRYDLFFFVDHPQLLRWYVHYSAYYYTLIILALVLYSIQGSKIWKVFTKVFLWVSVFRALEYWSFRFTIGIESAAIGIIIFTLSILKNHGKRTVL